MKNSKQEQRMLNKNKELKTRIKNAKQEQRMLNKKKE